MHGQQYIKKLALISSNLPNQQEKFLSGGQKTFHYMTYLCTLWHNILIGQKTKELCESTIHKKDLHFSSWNCNLVCITRHIYRIIHNFMTFHKIFTLGCQKGL